MNVKVTEQPIQDIRKRKTPITITIAISAKGTKMMQRIVNTTSTSKMDPSAFQLFIVVRLIGQLQVCIIE